MKVVLTAARKVERSVAATVEKSVVRKVAKKADNLAVTLDVKKVARWVAL